MLDVAAIVETSKAHGERVRVKTCVIHKCVSSRLYQSLNTVCSCDGEMRPTLCDVVDAVLEVGPSAAPGHVLQTERLVGPQHDDLDGT